MRVGLDLDYTISEMPWLFSVLSSALRAQKHQVHVITYRDPRERKMAEAELEQFGIAYDSLEIAPDGVLAPAWKAKVANDLHIDVMFDDDPEVLDALPEFTKRVWICDPEVFNLGVAVAALKDHGKLPVIR